VFSRTFSSFPICSPLFEKLHKIIREWIFKLKYSLGALVMLDKLWKRRRF
jgi:hypothetical protein